MKNVILILALISSMSVFGQTYTFDNALIVKKAPAYESASCNAKFIFSKTEVIMIYDNSKPDGWYHVRVDKIVNKPFRSEKNCTWYYCTDTELQKMGVDAKYIFVVEKGHSVSAEVTKLFTDDEISYDEVHYY